MLRARGRAGLVAWGPLLLAGSVLVGVGAADRTVLAAVASPPLPARLALGAAALTLGVLCLLRGLERLDQRDDAAALVRGVRLLFLAVGAAAAALGWLALSPVALVAALIIAGVDVVETTFLLLVTARRQPERREGA